MPHAVARSAAARFYTAPSEAGRRCVWHRAADRAFWRRNRQLDRLRPDGPGRTRPRRRFWCRRFGFWRAAGQKRRHGVANRGLYFGICGLRLGGGRFRVRLFNGRVGLLVAPPLHHGALTLVSGAVQRIGAAEGTHFFGHRQVVRGSLAEQREGGDRKRDRAGDVDEIRTCLRLVGFDCTDRHPPREGNVDGIGLEERDEMVSNTEHQVDCGIDRWKGMAGRDWIGHEQGSLG